MAAHAGITTLVRMIDAAAALNPQKTALAHRPGEVEALLHGIIPESQMNFWLVQNSKDIVMINRMVCPTALAFHGGILYYRASITVRDEPENRPVVRSLTPEGAASDWFSRHR